MSSLAGGTVKKLAVIKTFTDRSPFALKRPKMRFFSVFWTPRRGKFWGFGAL